MSHTDSRSVLLHQIYSEQNSQFDRFVLGATLAACAYLAQTNPFGKIALNIESLYLLSLLTLVAAAYKGFRRIETCITAIQTNGVMLGHLEMQRNWDADALRGSLEIWRDKSSSAYRWRNRLLLLSFILYILTKVVEAYVR
ncbi:hypothetical protein MCB86_08870 [Pseudomonas sp. KSR10]|uniref:hypothetical protein n=1 Tax=Pseudomonas sp. KSR10 TaxID=2916654 RepID=UPI001EF929D3|nr:hypothetical protein [Pseudomonas sp. KSR10]MCG6540187.1 hypothetical protein [Pseudomonas sp. KSR10]